MTDHASKSRAICAVQVVPRIADRSSGPSVSVPTLCKSLQDAGVHTTLMTLTPSPETPLFDNLVQFEAIPFAKRLGVSPKMKRALCDAAAANDIIHNHSLWMMPNVYPFAAINKSNCKLVVSPRGTLSSYALSRSRFRKRVIWHLGQKNALLRADCIHATSTQERDEAREIGFTGPIAVIPNGVQIPKALPAVETSKTRSVLFLARIHPKKGVDRLLRAWSVLEGSFTDWQLKIAGPLGHAYAREMQKVATDLKLKKVMFLGEVAGSEKSNTFANADLYVLPTHSENFGISVAEALAHGIPAIVTKGAPWSGLVDHDAGWWIDHELDSLIETMRIAMSKEPRSLQEMGEHGRQWMSDEYEWAKIGVRMKAVYEWLCRGGKPTMDIHVA